MRVLVVLAIAAIVGIGLWWHAGQQRAIPADPAAVRPPGPAFEKVVFPTDQQDLLEEPRAGVFQPTAAGVVESALYGSVRTVRAGRGMASSFHEGIDIAPLRRDARGMPLDRVYTVADGTVGYANRVAGNSNYGLYVVVVHDDPVGPVYTLYAHMASIEPGIRDGAAVRMGETLGRMGNTPASTIPASRAHLHFEVGMLSHSRFGDWCRARRLPPDHGMFNGMNLLALDPREFFRAQRETRRFTFRDFLRQVPVAFEILVRTGNPPDYFRRYPALWEGEKGQAASGGMVLSCSANGTPLRGRPAREEEIRGAAGRRAKVLSADAGVLGRNGCHLVQRDGAGWRLGPKGDRWLEILTYP